MKKSLLTILLTIALLGLLAAPAAAGPTAQTVYPPLDTPIMVPAFGPGVWCYGTSLAVSDISIYQAAVRGRDFKPVPVGRDIVTTIGWFGAVYGQVNDLPHQVAVTIDITGPDGFHQHFGPATTEDYWCGAHAWDAWWTEWIGAPPPDCFNPAIQAGIYWNHLWLPIGPFPVAGTYHYAVDMVQLLPSIDLCGWWEVGRPYHLTVADVNWGTEFDFVVGK